MSDVLAEIESNPQDDEQQFEEPQAEEAQAEYSQAEESQPEPPPAETPQPERVVPLAALHEERERRRDLQNQISRMEGRFHQVMDRFNNPPTPEPQVPDYDENPAEHLRHRAEQAERQISEINHARQAQGQYAAQQQQVAQTAQYLQQQESSFRANNPDYDNAAEFLRQSRINEYKILGLDDAAAAAAVVQEALQLTAQTSQSGRNPAEHFYELAKLRGYRKTEATQSVADLKDRVEQSTSLGASGATTRQTTLADLAAVSDDEFDKLTDGAAWERLWQ